MAYLIGIPTARFLPGLLRGIEGFNQPVLLAAVLIEPTTLRGVVGRERSVNSLAPFAILVGMALLGGPLIEPSPIRTLSLPGYMLISPFEGCSDLCWGLHNILDWTRKRKRVSVSETETRFRFLRKLDPG